jgi:hypothetical protein
MWGFMDILSNLNYLKRVIFYSLSNQKVQIFMLPTVYVMCMMSKGYEKLIFVHLIENINLVSKETIKLPEGIYY